MVENIAIVKLYGHTVGAVVWVQNKGHAVFEYDNDFVSKGCSLSPIHMPLTKGTRYSFSGLNPETFKGLPGLLADSLPDKFGNDLINIWLAQKGLSTSNFSPVDRLCYQGTRGMGALEFFPLIDNGFEASIAIEIKHLVDITQKALSHKNDLDVYFDGSEPERRQAIAQILSVSTSAGGARPKAVLAINSEGHVLSGQTQAPEGYEHWLLKFDGVTDSQLGEPQDYGKIEYAYHLMAKDAQINMTECRLLEESGRHHFMTRRFDREDSRKIHMQTLCGLCHYDYSSPGSYSYEQAFAVMRSLKLPKSDAEQQFRRMIFNVITRNQDDHTKNISFLMDNSGEWHLSPAYDVTYSHNPAGHWTNQHQMSINGKRDDFKRNDFKIVGDSIGIKNTDEIIDQIIDVVSQWTQYAQLAGLEKQRIEKIANGHRILAFGGTKAGGSVGKAAKKMAKAVVPGDLGHAEELDTVPTEKRTVDDRDGMK